MNHNDKCCIKRNHSNGKMIQSVATEFVETDEIVARCAGFRHLAQQRVEKRTKECYNAR